MAVIHSVDSFGYFFLAGVLWMLGIWISILLQANRLSLRQLRRRAGLLGCVPGLIFLYLGLLYPF